MTRLFVAVGLPGSGKSYLYEHNYSFAEYVSSDRIREEVFGNVNDQSHNNEVFNIMFNRTVAALKDKKDVYYDATNISAKRRINFLKEINRIISVEMVCVLNVPPLEIVKERNAARERKVPEYVIERMLKNFEVPHESEGWDDIIIYGSDINSDCLHEMVKAAKSISHDNHHHSLSIGDHMEAAQRYMIKRPEKSFLNIIAALFHDIGKPYCKVFHNSKGEPTNEAHYYNHENVGAYFYLSHSEGSSDDLYIANLINHHMDHYKGESYMKKIASRFDEDFINDLSLLHEADKAAH
jgi:predicted kinase